MSEIVHPPVEFDVRLEASLEQVFVEETCLLLRDCGRPRKEFTASKKVTTQATDRVDMQGAIPTETVSLRLRTLAVMLASSPSNESREPSQEYAAIMMEYTSFTTDGTIRKDDDLLWKPYVLIALGDLNPKELNIVNATTGQNLDSSDLVTAHMLLGRMREELRKDLFKKTNPVSYLAVDQQPLTISPTHKPFESAAFIDTEVCFDDCSNPHLACNHSPYSLN